MYCRRCGATLHQGVVICPECGARQRRGISAVRCARCGHRVSLGLTVCPHCGRDVHPAGPRWGLWLAGFVVVAVAALWGLGELPIERMAEQVAVDRDARRPVSSRYSGRPRAANGRLRKPHRRPRPIAQLPSADGLRHPPSDPHSDHEPTVTIRPRRKSLPPTAISITATTVITPTLEATDGRTPTATPTETPTAEPTETPTATPTNTPVPGRTTYKVKSGDTLSSIAAQFGIAWQALAAANGLTSRSTLRARAGIGHAAAGRQPARGASACARAAPRTR